MDILINKLSIILADTYALYLKTQNYHWHVKGPQFRSLHELFDAQYHELADAVDAIAERILIKGHHAPATFAEFERLKTIKDGFYGINANQMVTELADDHRFLVNHLQAAMSSAQEFHDEGTVNLLTSRIEAHEKARWMLSSSQDNAS
ncbi:MAG: Dps family protein [Legionella sp.]